MPLEHRTSKTVVKGRPYPLGATPVADGVNFAVYSRHASDVFLLLFDSAGGEPTDVIQLDVSGQVRLARRGQGRWSGPAVWLQGARPLPAGVGAALQRRKAAPRPVRQGVHREVPQYRQPAARLRFPPGRRRARSGYARQHRHRSQSDRHRRQRLRLAGRHARRTSGSRSWSSTKCTSRASRRTRRRACRSPGTYLGFIEKIPHLQRLGVNAVELLPVHEFYVDDFLIERGLTNYWGYNSIGFFAPESSYGTGQAPGCQVDRVQDARSCAARGGHRRSFSTSSTTTPAKATSWARALSFRGIDNPSYYSLTGPPDAPRRYYMNFTGCGNSLELRQPAP